MDKEQLDALRELRENINTQTELLNSIAVLLEAKVRLDVRTYNLQSRNSISFEQLIQEISDEN